MRDVHHGLSQAALRETGDAIAATQLPAGAIPWFPDGQVDPWDHTEAAMGLDVAGLHEAARAAYEWLRQSQNADGSWYRGYRGSTVEDRVKESNFTAYVAVGLLHHIEATRDPAFLDRMWPTVVAAIEFTLGLQSPGGEIRWARDETGAPADEALLTGCASMFHSLRCALELARRRDEPQPDWELAATTLGHALVAHAERFAPREHYSMDWYYPILGGALRGQAAAARLDAGWSAFVVPGLGLRCVSDRPWVTGAETCELVLALCAIGDHARAGELFANMQHLRHDDGSYWTGYVYPDDARWPEERTTWTAGAVLLASAALSREPATSYVFGGEHLPIGPDQILTDCDARHDLRAA